MDSKHTNWGLRVWRTAACAGLGIGIAVSTQAAPLMPPAAMRSVGPGPTYVQAGPERGLTKAQFIERRRQKATSEGQNPDQAAAQAERIFDMIDTNHDGIMSRAEVEAFKAAHPGIGGGAAGSGPAAR